MKLQLKITLFIDKVFPFSGPLKRFVFACYHSYTPIRKSYSQYHEDNLILHELRDWNYKDSIYVDVGANHPTRISNSYLLYRKGWSGITVEPNGGLIKLHRLFRSRDVQVNVGCGAEASFLRFYVSRTPVLSSFAKNEVEHILRVKYLPVLTVDQLLAPFQDKKIAMLSIDTEGFDLNVIKGATETLKRTYLVCVEANDNDEHNKITSLLAEDFEHFVTVGCNLLFRNRHEDLICK